MSMDRDFPTIPGGSTTAESHQHRFFNDPRSPTILFTGCATIPVKIPSQCINGSLLSMDRDSPTIPGGPPRRRSDDPGGPSTVESQQHRFLNDPRFPTILFYRLRNDPRQNTIPVLNGSLMSMDLDFQRSRGGHHGGVPINTGSSTIPASQRSLLPVAQRSPSKYHPSPQWIPDVDGPGFPTIPGGATTAESHPTPVLQRSPLPNDPFLPVAQRSPSKYHPSPQWIPDVDGRGFPTIPGGPPRRRPDDPGAPSTVESQQHRFFNDPRFPTILFYRLRNDPRQNTIPVLNGSLMSMDRDFQRSRGGHHGGVPINTGSSTIPASQRSFLPVAQRSPSKYHPSPQCDPFCRWTWISNDTGEPTTAESRRSPGGFNDHGWSPNNLFYRFFNDPRQNTIPVIKRSLLLMDLDCATIPGCLPRRSTIQHRSFNDPRFPTIFVTDCAPIPVKIPSQSSNDPCCWWPTTAEARRPRGAQHGGVPTTPVLQRSPLPNDPLYRLRNDPRQNTIPVLNGSLMSMDRDFQRSRGATHGGVPTTPILQRSPVPNDPFYRLRNDPRQNTIPVIERSLLLMDLDSQRSRGAHHGGVPTPPVLQRSPLPNDLFYRLRNDPRQNTIPVIKRSLLLVDLDSQRSRGAPHGGVPTPPVLQRSPLPNDPFYRLRNDPRQNTIPVIKRSLLLMDLDSQRSRGAHHGGVPTPPVLQRSPLPNDLFYRLRNDPRQNTIPVIERSLLLMDLDSQRSRGAHHGGVPTPPVLQRSPLPNDPFYRLRNDPRQNTIPVIERSLLLMDLDSQRSRGAHHDGVPTTPVLQRSPLPNDLFYRLCNDPRQNTIPVIERSLLLMDLDSQRSRGSHHGGVPTPPVLQRSPLPNDLFYRLRNDPRQNTIPVIKRSLLLVDLDSQRPGVPTTAESLHHRFFNDPRFPTILFTGCAIIPVKIPSQSSNDPCC